MNQQQKRIAMYQEVKRYYAGLPFLPSFPAVKYVYAPRAIQSKSPVDMPVTVWDMDTIDCAYMLKYELGFNPVVLNMANAYTAGGGVESGAIAQEESLFRRSNYHLSTTPELYPIGPTELLYSPKVHISRKSDGQPVDKDFYLDFIASAAIDSPCLMIDGAYTPSDRELMRLKIEHIFQKAYDLGHDSILLGAFGCGAFRNPPDQVVELFEHVLDQFSGYFRRVDFAILKHVYGKTSGLDNFDIFDQYFRRNVKF